MGVTSVCQRQRRVVIEAHELVVCAGAARGGACAAQAGIKVCGLGARRVHADGDRGVAGACVAFLRGGGREGDGERGRRRFVVVYVYGDGGGGYAAVSPRIAYGVGDRYAFVVRVGILLRRNRYGLRAAIVGGSEEERGAVRRRSSRAVDLDLAAVAARGRYGDVTARLRIEEYFVTARGAALGKVEGAFGYRYPLRLVVVVYVHIDGGGGYAAVPARIAYGVRDRYAFVVRVGILLRRNRYGLGAVIVGCCEGERGAVRRRSSRAVDLDLAAVAARGRYGDVCAWLRQEGYVVTARGAALGKVEGAFGYRYPRRGRFVILNGYGCRGDRACLDKARQIRCVDRHREGLVSLVCCVVYYRDCYRKPGRACGNGVRGLRRVVCIRRGRAVRE